MMRITKTFCATSYAQWQERKLLINPTSVLFGHAIYPPGSTLGPRRWHTYEFVLIYHGSMTVAVNGVPVMAGPNSATLLFPGDEECFCFSKTCETHHAWLHLALPDLALPLSERIKRLPHVIPLSAPMRGLMDHLLELRTCPLPTTQELMKTVAAQLLWRFVGEAEQLAINRQDKLRSAMVERVKDYVYAHLHEELTLNHLTAAASLSPAHLTRLFHSQVGQTPMEYVWQQRVKRGVELLEFTGLTVEQIALRCGFKTSYHFSRRVRAITGRPPTQIRSQANHATVT